MILNFPDFTEYEKEYDDILEIEEKAEVPEALMNYFKEMKSLINKKDEPILRNLEDKDIKSIKLNLENYIFNKLYYKLFPSEYSVHSQAGRLSMRVSPPALPLCILNTVFLYQTCALMSSPGSY